MTKLMSAATEIMLDPNHPESLYEPCLRGGYRPDEVGNRVECKACAKPIVSTLPFLRQHAYAQKTLSDGSVGTCSQFWRDTHSHLVTAP